MRWYRCYAAMLLALVLAVGLALGTSGSARADDLGGSIGRAVLGALLSGAFDRDYPPGSITFGRGSPYGGGNYGYGGTGPGYGGWQLANRSGGYGYCERGYGCGNQRPTWFYYPQSGVFAFPGSARPYPYGIRWWQYAGRYQQRLVFVPAMYQGWGDRETLRFPAQRPMFVLPNQQYASYPGYGGQGYGYGGQGYGYGGQGYGYGGQGYGNRTDGFFPQRDWQPSPALQSYRAPAKGWRKDWNPQRDGWYDLEAQTWRKAPGPNDDKVSGAGQDDEEPTTGPPQKVKPEFDESWRSDMKSDPGVGNG